MSPCSHSPIVSVILAESAPNRGDPFLGPVQGSAPVGGGPVPGPAPMGRGPVLGSAPMGGGPIPGSAPMERGPAQVLLPWEEIPFRSCSHGKRSRSRFSSHGRRSRSMSHYLRRKTTGTHVNHFFIISAVSGSQFSNNDYQTNFSWFDC